MAFWRIFISLATLVGLISSASVWAETAFNDEALKTFVKKANYSGDIIEIDGIRSGLALFHFKESSSTETVFVFSGNWCRGETKGRVPGKVKLSFICSKHENADQNQFVEMSGSGVITGDQYNAKGRFKLKIGNGSQREITVNLFQNESGLLNKITTLFLPPTSKKSELVASTSDSETSSKYAPETLKLQTLVRQAIRTNKSFRECLGKTHIGEDRVNTAYFRNMSQTAFLVHEEAVNTDCISMITVKALPVGQSKDSIQTSQTEPKKIISDDTSWMDGDQAPPSLKKHLYAQMTLACGPNKKGDKAWRNENVYAVISPHSVQANSFWINEKKNYVGQYIFRGLLQKSGLILNGEGRRSDKPKNPWRLKFKSTGEKTMLEHFQSGLQGYEGKDKWKRDCEIKLSRTVNASDALMLKFWQNKNGSLEIEKANLEKQRSSLFGELQQVKSNNEKLESEIATVEKAFAGASKSLESVTRDLRLKSDEHNIAVAKISSLVNELQDAKKQLNDQKVSFQQASSSTQALSQQLEKANRENERINKELGLKLVELQKTNQETAQLKKALADEKATRKSDTQSIASRDKEIKQLSELVSDLQAELADLDSALKLSQANFKKTMSQKELEQKIKEELDEKLSAKPEEINEILQISELAWSDLTTEIGDGFTNFQARQNNRLTIASLCLSNESNTLFALENDAIKFGVDLANGQRAFAISEALEALQAQNDPLIFPKHIDANAKACGSLVFEVPMNSILAKGVLFILNSDELIARQNQ